MKVCALIYTDLICSSSVPCIVCPYSLSLYIRISERVYFFDNTVYNCDKRQSSNCLNIYLAAYLKSMQSYANNLQEVIVIISGDLVTLPRTLLIRNNRMWLVNKNNCAPQSKRTK